MDNWNKDAWNAVSGKKSSLPLKSRLRDALLIVSALFAIMAFIAGLLGVMLLPTLLRDSFSSEASEAARSYLRLVYWSNLGILLFCAVGVLLSIAFAVVWFLLCMRRRRMGRFGSVIQLSALACLIVAFPLGISYMMIRGERIPGIVADCGADLDLLEKGETMMYEGVLDIGKGVREIPGPHYKGKPGGTRALTTSGGTGEFLRCPVPLADTLNLRQGGKYRVRYLPNTRTAVSVEEVAER